MMFHTRFFSGTKASWKWFFVVTVCCSGRDDDDHEWKRNRKSHRRHAKESKKAKKPSVSWLAQDRKWSRKYILLQSRPTQRLKVVRLGALLCFQWKRERAFYCCVAAAVEIFPIRVESEEAACNLQRAYVPLNMTYSQEKNGAIRL